MQLARRTTVSLAVAAFAPLLLLAFLQLASTLAQMRREGESRTLSRAADFVARVDGALMSDLGALSVLASAPYFRTAAWSEARNRAIGVMNDYPQWENAVLTEAATGRQIWRTGREAETSSVREGALTFARQNRPSSVGGFAEASPSCRCIALQQRVAVGDRVYVLTVERDVSDFQRMLLSSIEPGEIAALVDRRGLFIARTADYETRKATSATHYVRDAVAQGGRGVYAGVTYEGLRNRTAYATSALSGWSAHIAVPAANYNWLGAGSLGSAVLAILFALGLAGAIAWYAIRDLAERRRDERAMLQTQKLTAIGQMSSAVVHDFNNLLAVLVACLRLLERHDDPGRKQELIAEGLSAAERGGKLINQLLSFARDRPIELQIVDLKQTLEGIRGLISRTLGPGIVLDLTVASNASVAWTNATQFELVVLNLAANARDAMPDGGAFSIVSRTSPARGFVDVVVRDTGVGMSEEVAARALEPFFTTKEDGKGTGLGLAQAHLLMEQSGGALLLETAPGKGAVFTLRMRASAPDNRAGPQDN